MESVAIVAIILINEAIAICCGILYGVEKIKNSKKNKQQKNITNIERKDNIELDKKDKKEVYLEYINNFEVEA